MLTEFDLRVRCSPSCSTAMGCDFRGGERVKRPVLKLRPHIQVVQHLYRVHGPLPHRPQASGPQPAAFWRGRPLAQAPGVGRLQPHVHRVVVELLFVVIREAGVGGAPPQGALRSPAPGEAVHQCVLAMLVVGGDVLLWMVVGVAVLWWVVVGVGVLSGIVTGRDVVLCIVIRADIILGLVIGRSMLGSLVIGHVMLQGLVIG